jgi:hypothetical protein
VYCTINQQEKKTSQSPNKQKTVTRPVFLPSLANLADDLSQERGVFLEPFFVAVSHVVMKFVELLMQVEMMMSTG